MTGRIARTFRSPAAGGLAVLVVAGCAPVRGLPFPDPDPAALRLGATTPAEAVALLGPPFDQRQMVVAAGQPHPPPGDFDRAFSPGTYLEYRYYFVDTAAPAAGPHHPRKDLFLEFFNGTLTGYTRVSDLPGSSTEFAAARVADIHSGSSSAEDVERMLGTPSGQAIYPTIRDPGDKLLAYWSERFDSAAGRIVETRADILIDAQGKVADTRLKDWSPGAPPAPP